MGGASSPLARARAGGFEVDETDWPVVVVRYPTEFEDDSFRALFAHYDVLCERGERIAWLIDFLQFNPVLASAARRRLASELFERHRPTLRRGTLCEARVVSSAMARGTLTAFDWLTGTKWPCGNFGSFDEAYAWIARQRAGSAL